MLSKIVLFALTVTGLISACHSPAVRTDLNEIRRLSKLQKDSLLLFADSIKKNSSAADLKTNVDYLVAMGYYHAKLARYELSRHLFREALKSVDTTDKFALGKVYNSLGNAAFNLGEYPEALQLYKKSLNYFSEIGDKHSQAGIHANLSQLFQLKGDNAQSRQHYKLGLSLLGDQKNTSFYLLMLHAMANVYGQSNLIDSALMIDKEGLTLAHKMKLPEYESMFLDNKANCFMYSNRPDSAKIYFNKSLAIDIALGNIKQQSDTWLNFGVLATMQKKPDSAETFLKRSIGLAKQSGYREGELYALKTLSELYEQNKHYEDALQIQKQYYTLKDSVSGDKKEAAIAEWKSVFETEQKEQEIRLSKIQLERKNLIIGGLVAISVLASLAVYLAAKRKQLKKEKIFNEHAYQQEQEAAAALINSEENERRRIAAELHDGVGQTMTAAWLNLQAITTDPDMSSKHVSLLETTTQLVQDSCNEIRGISHHMMPDVLLSKGLIPALKALTSNSAQKNLSVILSAEEQQVKLDKMQELTLYRVIQECFQNILKHARASEVDISINQDAGGISLMIEDNGTGFDVDEVSFNKGMGLNSICSRVHFLKGTVEWNTSSGNGGTLVAIHVPL